MKRYYPKINALIFDTCCALDYYTHEHNIYKSHYDTLYSVSPLNYGHAVNIKLGHLLLLIQH